MYSYEDRIRAVKVYIALGRRMSVALRQLGYPTKNALKSWCREYEQQHDLPAGYVRTKPKYSDDQKLAAVEHYLNHGCCLAYTVKAIGYPGRETLAAWVSDRNPEAQPRAIGSVSVVAHTQDSKKAAVIDLCTRQESAGDLAKRVGVSRQSLYNWKDQLLGRETPLSMKRQNDSQPQDRATLERTIEALQRDVRRLQLEHDLLKKANELLKKGLGVRLTCLSNREKTQLVDALRQAYALSELLAELNLARSSYFYHRGRLRCPDKYAAVRFAITDIFEHNHRCYGYRRMRAALRQEQYSVSEKVVRRLMRQEQLKPTGAKRRRYRSYGGEISPAPENLINRNFRASAPNRKWLTDLTEFQIPAGKVYLSPIIDCFDGLVVSCSSAHGPMQNW